MNSSTIAELRNPNSPRAKYALRLSIVLLVATLEHSVQISICTNYQNMQVYIFTDVTVFAALLNILAVRFSLQNELKLQLI